MENILNFPRDVGCKVVSLCLVPYKVREEKSMKLGRGWMGEEEEGKGKKLAFLLLEKKNVVSPWETNFHPLQTK